MRAIFLLALFLTLISPVYACSCLKDHFPLDDPEHPQNQPHFTFKVISGDLVLSSKTENEGDDFSTLIEVVASGTTSKKAGERLKLIQKRNRCVHSFTPPYLYKFLGESSGVEIIAGYCNIKYSPQENDKENFEKWLSNQRPEAEIND